MQPKEKIVLMHRISQIDDIIRRGTYLSASQIAKEVVVSLPFLKYNMQNIHLQEISLKSQKISMLKTMWIKPWVSGSVQKPNIK